MSKLKNLVNKLKREGAVIRAKAIKDVKSIKDTSISTKKLTSGRMKMKINTSPMGYKSQIRTGRIPQSTINRIEQNMPNNILSRPSDNYNLLRQKKLFTRGD